MEFFKELPKIELHAHLNGSLSNATILELHKNKYNQVNKDVNFAKYTMFADSLLNLRSCFEKFEFAHDLNDNAERIMLATEMVIKDFSKDNVIYLELRSTPKENAFMTKKQYISSICETILKCQIKYPDILVKFLPSIDRAQNLENAESSLRAILETKQKFHDLIVGIDLSGDPEVGNNFELFLPVLQKLRDSELKIAIHTAETKGKSAEVSKILEFKPDRIGHGTFLNETPENWKTFLSSKVLVECCFTSNFKCGTVSDLKNHHAKALLENGLPFAICTDDFGVFDTTLSKEIEICTMNYNLSHKTIKKIQLDSIEHSFASKTEKDDLISIVNDWFAFKNNK